MCKLSSMFDLSLHINKHDTHRLPADNLEENGSEHYRRRTLYFTIGENDPLYKQCFVDADPPQAKRQKH